MALASLLLLACFASAGANDSLNTVEPIPVYFNEFWEQDPFWPLPWDAMQYLDSLELDRIDLRPDEINQSFFAEDKADFQKGIEEIRQARMHLELAKKARDEARLGIDETADALLSAGITFFVPGSMIGEGEGIGKAAGAIALYYGKTAPLVRLSYSESAEALSLVASAANRGKNKVAEKGDRLDQLGADYPNYSGAAASSYAKVRDAVVLSRQYEGMPFPNGEYDDFARSYLLARSRVLEVQEAFDGTPGPYSMMGRYASAVNGLAGREDNVFAREIGLNNELIEAQDLMNEEFLAWKNEAGSKKASADKSIADMDKAEYKRMDEEIAKFFAPSGTGLQHAAQSPKSLLLRVKDLVNGAGGASSLIGEASLLSLEKGSEDYLARAIERMKLAELKAGEAVSAAGEAESVAEGLDENAEKTVAQELKLAKDASAAFSPKTSGEAAAKANASRMISGAEKTISDARGKEIGSRLEMYRDAVVELRLARYSLGVNQTDQANAKKQAEDALDKLKEVVGKAKKDGLNVEAEEEFIALAEALAPVADAETLAELVARASEFRQAILEQSEARFEELNGKRLEMRSVLYGLGGQLAFLGLSNYWSMLLEIERDYVSGDSFDLERALGNYKEIKQKLDSIELGISAKKAEALSGYLGANAKKTVLFEETPALDKETGVSVLLEFRNGLKLENEGLVEVEVPLELQVDASEVADKSPEVSRVSYANGKVKVAFERIEAGKEYFVLFKAKRALASTVNSVDAVEFVKPEELKKKRSIEFNAVMDLPALEISQALKKQPIDFKAFYKGVAVSSVVKGEDALEGVALLEKVGKGRGQAVLVYSYSGPYSVSTRSKTFTPVGYRLRISFEAVVENSVEDLESVPVQVIEPPGSGVAAGSLSVAGSNCAPKSVRAQVGVAGVAISWDAGPMSAGSTCVFFVGYEANASDYTQAKNSSLAGSAYQSELLRAQELMAQGKYDEAAAILAEVEEKIANSSRNPLEPSQESVEAQLEALNGAQSELNETKKALLASGRLKDALETQASLEESEAEEAVAVVYLGQGNYEAAAKSIAKAFSKLDESEARQALLSWMSDLTKQANSLKSKASDISEIADVKGVLGKIGSAQALVSGAGESLAAKEYSQAAASLASASAEATGASDEINAAAEDVYDDLVEQQRLFMGMQQTVPSLFAGLENAVKVTVDKKVYVGGKLEAGFDIAALKASAEGDIRRLNYLYQKLGANKVEFVFGNVAAIKAAFKDFQHLNESKERVEKEVVALRKQSQASLNSALLAVDGFEKASEGEADSAKQVVFLQDQARQARNAFSDGRYSDCALVSSFIQDKVAGYLKGKQGAAKPFAFEFGNEALIAVVSLVLIAALAYLFLGKKKEEPPMSVLKRRHGEF